MVAMGSFVRLLLSSMHIMKRWNSLSNTGAHDMMKNPFAESPCSSIGMEVSASARTLVLHTPRMCALYADRFRVPPPPPHRSPLFEMDLNMVSPIAIFRSISNNAAITVLESFTD